MLGFTLNVYADHHPFAIAYKTKVELRFFGDDTP
jgi:hypothetical protein